MKGAWNWVYLLTSPPLISAGGDSFANLDPVNTNNYTIARISEKGMPKWRKGWDFREHGRDFRIVKIESQDWAEGGVERMNWILRWTESKKEQNSKRWIWVGDYAFTRGSLYLSGHNSRRYNTTAWQLKIRRSKVKNSLRRSYQRKELLVDRRKEGMKSRNGKHGKYLQERVDTDRVKTPPPKAVDHFSDTILTQ